jgi:hypothetical protein
MLRSVSNPHIPDEIDCGNDGVLERQRLRQTKKHTSAPSFWKAPIQRTYFKIGPSVATVKERAGTVGFICDSALRNEWQIVAHHTASPVGAFSSGIALKVCHLVEFGQEFLTFISSDCSNIIERALVESVQQPFPMFRIPEQGQYSFCLLTHALSLPFDFFWCCVQFTMYSHAFFASFVLFSSGKSATFLTF